MTPDDIKWENLREHLKKRFAEDRNQFPADGVDYLATFEEIAKYLNENVHSYVVAGAAAHGDGLLNDHGKEHIEMVIQRASLLLHNKVEQLKGYEIFLLLLAIHFHDVGNIAGRDGHETRIFEIMSECPHISRLDRPTQEYVTRIAMAHGGELPGGNKDTISLLPPEDMLNGVMIHPAPLAAILRFADEISDDRSRAARFMIESNTLPPENEIFHRYSHCLQPIAITGHTLVLKFDLPVDCGKNKCGKKHESGCIKEFLYDEILKRLKKCLCEMEYCSKYSLGLLQLTAISVDIKVYAQKKLYPIHSEYLRLQICGYPGIAATNILDLLHECPKASNGEELRAILEELENS